MNDVTRFANLPANAIEAAAYDALPLADALADAGYSRAAETVRWIGNENVALEDKIELLEDKIETLEERIKALEWMSV